MCPPRVSLLPLLLVLLAMTFASTLAQPYAAGGGFSRPAEVGSSEVSTMIALSAGPEGPTVYWSDRRGILARNPLTGEPERRVVEGRGIRGLTAAEVRGDSALAWVRRDLGTGRTSHRLRWRSEERLLLEALQPYDLSIVAVPAGPAVLLARREDDRSVLRLIGWDGRETLVHSSELSLVRYRGLFGSDGVLRVVWLEGYTDRAAVGFAAAEWTAYLAELDPQGDSVDVTELGPARYLGIESQTVLAESGGSVYALWPGPDGEVLFARPGEEPLTAGYGSPVGVSDGWIYWADGSSLRRRHLAGETEAQNVAWSPATITRAELGESEGDRYLAWYGPTRGGDFRVFASHDRRALRPALKDRVAALMGWSPWGFWQALFGQLLGAMFAGVLLSMALSPLLWLGSVALAAGAPAKRPVAAGIGLGAAVLVLLLALVSASTRLDRVSQVALLGSAPEVLASLLLAGALTWLLRRRADSERLLGVLSSAWLFVLAGTSFLAFLNLQAWLDYWA